LRKEKYRSTYPDRPTRFGFKILEFFFQQHGTEIVALNEKDKTPRRAQHLIQHFLKTVKYQKTVVPKSFDRILTLEAFLHLANPWILITGVTLLIIASVEGSIPAAILLITGLVLLFLKEYRTWITQQLYLTAAQVRNLKTREIAWSKQAK